MGAKRMRTSRQQLIEEPATLADRTANGAGADAEPARKLASEGERHIKLLAEALGKCLVAAGIVRSDAALTGPELLMFAEDLERALSSPNHTQCCNGLSPQECADVPSRHCDGMRSGRDHADAGKLVEGGEWLPIESAPKDGTLFLAYCPADEDFPDGRMMIWKGSIFAFQKNPTPNHLQFPATHWRPLPSAPSQEVAGS